MTCIVGLIENGTIYMAGDSGTKTGRGQETRASPKIYKKNNEFIIGGAGYLTIMQIMSHSFPLPKYEKGDVLGYIINKIVPKLRKKVIDKGQMHLIEGNTESMESEFLIGFKKRLFILGNDFHVFESAERFTAVGTGAKYAIGVLNGTVDMDLTPEQRLSLALTTASKYEPYILPPFEIKSVGNKVDINMDNILKKANEEIKKE